MLKRFFVVAAICGTVAIGFTAATAVSATTATPATKAGSQQSHIQVGFKVGKFVKRGHNLAALGSVTARVTKPDGTTQSFAQPFTARVARVKHGAACPVLLLRLDKLSLNLLGLHVDLDKVVLSITANPNGGALGSLFCKLARTRVSLHSLAGRRHLTKVLHASSLSKSDSLVGVSAPMSPQQQQTTGTYCPILDLVLGPLHLELLGLVVDLNQVHLSITADPNGGTLGSLFCSIAGSTTTDTTTTSTTSTTTTT